MYPSEIISIRNISQVSSINDSDRMYFRNKTNFVNFVNLDKIYKKNSSVPFEVYVDSKNSKNNIDNLHIFRLSKIICDLRNKEVEKINIKSENRIAVVFKNSC